MIPVFLCRDPQELVHGSPPNRNRAMDRMTRMPLVGPYLTVVWSPMVGLRAGYGANTSRAVNRSRVVGGVPGRRTVRHVEGGRGCHRDLVNLTSLSLSLNPGLRLSAALAGWGGGPASPGCAPQGIPWILSNMGHHAVCNMSRHRSKRVHHTLFSSWGWMAKAGEWRVQ